MDLSGDEKTRVRQSLGIALLIRLVVRVADHSDIGLIYAHGTEGGACWVVEIVSEVANDGLLPSSGTW